jgi:hypothetical protein
VEDANAPREAAGDGDRSDSGELFLGELREQRDAFEQVDVFGAQFSSPFSMDGIP